MKTICIDFDGVISDYKGWQGVGVFAPPITGVRDAMLRLKMCGCTIIIHTTRGETDAIASYMEKHSLPYDHINHNPEQLEHMNPGKPIADVYIDDRALCFDGVWDAEFVKKILTHKPHYRR